MIINEAGWGTFGFIIFCIIAWRYGAKPFVDVLESRANEVKEKLAEAETLRNEAKEVLNNYNILQQEAAEEANNII
jgi:F-type H+-transporting ATPase subunit b